MSTCAKCSLLDLRKLQARTFEEADDSFRDTRKIEGIEVVLSPMFGRYHPVPVCFMGRINMLELVQRGDTAKAEGYQIVLVKDRNGEERRVFPMGFNHWTFGNRNGRWYVK